MVVMVVTTESDTTATATESAITITDTKVTGTKTTGSEVTETSTDRIVPSSLPMVMVRDTRLRTDRMDGVLAMATATVACTWTSDAFILVSAAITNQFGLKRRLAVATLLERQQRNVTSPTE